MTKNFSREKVIAAILQTKGNSETPNTTTVTVTDKDASGYVTGAKGATVPTDAETGYLKGATFIKTDAAAGVPNIYVNVGDHTSCDFNVVGSDLPAGSIDATELATDSVAADEIATGAVGADEIATGAVASDEILDGTVTNTDLATPKLVVYQETCPVASFTDNLDATGQLDLATTIPAGAVFERATIHNVVGFAGDVSAVLTIGDGTDVDRYNTGTPSVFTTAAQGLDMGAPSGTAWHTAAVTPRLTITGNADFTSIVGEGNGTLVVTLFYYRPA